MNKSSLILLTNLAIFTACSIYGKASRDIFFMMVWIALQFVTNLLAGITIREGRPAYLLSACLVLVIGFGVCIYDLKI